MKLPNKVITYSESIISKFPIVLYELYEHDYSVNELYIKLKHIFIDINDYLDILDCLYALNKIDFNKKNRRLYYVERNSL